MTANLSSANTAISDQDTLLRCFSARAKRLGVGVELITALDAVAALAADLAAAVPEETRRVVLAPGLERTYPALRQLLEARGITPTPVDTSNPAATFGPSAVGISEAALGIAETGSYLVADSFADRLVRMLAFRHLVVLDRAHLVPGLDEAGAWLRDRLTGADGSPAGHYASFVTGPSRTADIEMSLSVGAHGPAELRVLVLAENDEATRGSDDAGE